VDVIKLERAEWEYDPEKQLGSEGGFGVVFAGAGGGYGPVAVKRLRISVKEAAHRELRIARDLADREFVNVIPVYDSGQDANSNSYFVVMAIAQRSLQDELKGGKACDEMNVVAILHDIAKGLSEVTDIVHRDLKPGNVLYHAGKWKIADFGIARFVEDATSVQTLKGCWTPQYAAPEQWDSDRSTHATDIYALGCIGYCLLTGHPPFRGPGREDCKRQHLSEDPPSLDGHHPQLAALLGMMLRKTQEARPDVGRVLKVLEHISASASSDESQGGHSNLAVAGAEVVAVEAEEEAMRRSAVAELDRRKRIAVDAYKVLMVIREELFKRICANALPARIKAERVIKLGQAELGMHSILDDGRLVEHDAFPRSKWDVLAAGRIYITQARPKYAWSASLWYSKLPTHHNYRWREVSYFVNAFSEERAQYEPFELHDPSKADKAACASLGTLQIAYGPKPIDDEDFDSFYQRWGDLLAKAVRGVLEHPRVLPLE